MPAPSGSPRGCGSTPGLPTWTTAAALTVDADDIINFLVRQKDFSEDRVRKAVEKMQKGVEKQRGKTTLEKWFG